MPRLDSNEDLRPGPWRLEDALTFGGVSGLVTAVAVYAQVMGSDGPASGQTLLWVVSAAFWAIYGVLVWARWRFIASFDLVLPNGMMVRTNGYKAPLVEFEKELEGVKTLWSPHIPRAAELLRQSRVWVNFEAKKLKLSGFVQETPKLFAGLTSMGGESMRLTYFEDPVLPLSKTAFSHELGHIILGRSTGSWDNTTHHAFMKEHSLP